MSDVEKNLLEALREAKATELKTNKTAVTKEIAAILIKNYKSKDMINLVNRITNPVKVEAPGQMLDGEESFGRFKVWTPGKKTSTSSKPQKKDAADEVKPEASKVTAPLTAKKDVVADPEAIKAKAESLEADPKPDTTEAGVDPLLATLERVPGMNDLEIMEEFTSIGEILKLAKQLGIIIRAKKPDTIISAFRNGVEKALNA